MREFIGPHFLLGGETAMELYQEFAASLPIIDYHCHLDPSQIASDRKFENITQAWLSGDHYKWRAMRTNGIDESYCTGNRTYYEKFEKWAETVPYTIRNPLYHWTHLELRRYFDISDPLHPESAKKIYEQSGEKLATKEFSVQSLLRKMKVEVICTTDDPTDDLQHHAQINRGHFQIKVLPSFRPDKAMQVDHPSIFNAYVNSLEAAAGCSITTYSDYLEALKNRHDHFASHGCKVSDHGLEYIYSADYDEKEIKAIFDQVRTGKALGMADQIKIKSDLLYQFALWDHESGWVQQYHLGATRNNNSRMMDLLGPDTGWDSISDFSQARNLAQFLNRLDAKNQLAKTIIYNLNPADNAVFASMIGNFNDGSVPGKIQWGAAWWFLDQKKGIEDQLNALSNMGLLSRFVGMLTDSRSFLSYPRHEYFRRILCNLLGNEIDRGELPKDIGWMGKIIKDICYYNAKDYFGW
jgi:glucuronate isomerase